jgi:hypothetical protein
LCVLRAPAATVMGDHVATGPPAAVPSISDRSMSVITARPDAQRPAAGPVDYSPDRAACGQLGVQILTIPGRHVSRVQRHSWCIDLALSDRSWRVAARRRGSTMRAGRPMTRDALITRSALWKTAIFDLGFGLAYLLMPLSKTATPLYDPARHILDFQTAIAPMRLWAIFLLALTGLLMFSMGVRHRSDDFMLLALAAFWTFWTVLYVANLFQGGSWIPVLFCMAFADRHWTMVERASLMNRGG